MTTARRAAALYALAAAIIATTHLLCDWLDKHPKKERPRGR